MSETTQKVAELKRIPVLNMANFAQNAAYAIPFSHAMLPRGVTLEDALKPEFWAHVAYLLKPWGRILLDAEDNTFSALLKVVSCSRLEARVVVEYMAEHASVGQAVRPEDAYDVHFVNNRAKWRVTRKSDRKTISEGHADEATAKQELVSYLKAHAVPAQAEAA